MSAVPIAVKDQSAAALDRTDPADRLASARLALLLPALLALIYPWLVLALGGAIHRLGGGPGAASVTWTAVVLGLIAVYSVPAVSLAVAHALGRLDAPSPRQLQSRRIAHLAWMERRERVGVNADMVAKWERGAKGHQSAVSRVALPPVRG